MAANAVPKKKKHVPADDQTAKSNKTNKSNKSTASASSTGGTPKVKKKKKPASSNASVDSDDRSHHTAASTASRRKKRVPNSSTRSPNVGKKKPAAALGTASSSTTTTTPGSPKGRKKAAVTTAGTTTSPIPNSPASPRSGAAAKKKVGGARRSKSADRVTSNKPPSTSSTASMDDASGNSCGLDPNRKPPSVRKGASGRFSSPAATLKPPGVSRPSLTSIKEDKSAHYMNNNNNNNNNNNSERGGGGSGNTPKQSTSLPSPNSRKPMSLGSMGSMLLGGLKPLHSSSSNNNTNSNDTNDTAGRGAGRGGRGGGRGPGGRGGRGGPGPRAASMMHLGNRPSPRQPRGGANPHAMTPPPPRGKSFRTNGSNNNTNNGNNNAGNKPRRATSDITHIKRYQDAMGISSPGPAGNRKTSTRTDTAGNLHPNSPDGAAPQSILRNSSHHRRPIPSLSSGGERGGERGDRRARSASLDDPAVPVVGFGRTQSVDQDDEEVAINFEPKARGLLRKNPSNGMDLSGHSYHTQQSVLSIDKGEFEDDPHWKKALRYIRILPPHQNEKPDKKKARILTWAVLTLDFVAAMVSLTTYDGVQTCCGVQIFSLAANLDWNRAIRIITYVYLVFIFLEIIPVVRNGIPFNLVNPIMGFMITFAMFFDDRVGEAVCMWLIEASAIACEFWVYRIKSNVYHKREERLSKCDKDLEALKGKSTRNLTRSVSSYSFGSLSDDSDGDSFGGDSFVDESAFEDRSNFKLREVRILRERRILRQTQKADRVQLRYHSIGVAIGVGLVVISLILIVFIARAGGLCIRDGKRPIVFELNQLAKCDACQGTTGVCEICPEEGSDQVQQCYYPYLRTANK